MAHAHRQGELRAVSLARDGHRDRGAAPARCQRVADPLVTRLVARADTSLLVHCRKARTLAETPRSDASAWRDRRASAGRPGCRGRLLQLPGRDGELRRVRVLLLGPYPPPWGGVQTNLVALRDFLRRQGVTCTVVNLTRYRRPNEDDVHYPRSGLDVMRLLLRRRYDVIHLHIGGDLSRRLVLLGLACTVLPWAKVVLTFHSGGYP